MESKTLRELKIGKKIKIKHPEYQFTINAIIKFEENKREPLITIEKVSLPQKANRGEKLLLKLVQIYCYDVLATNLTKDVLESKEYEKLMEKARKTS
jgi:hypothetical protein